MLMLSSSLTIFGQASTLVSIDEKEKLYYNADPKGNTIPDFSGVGYLNSDSVIPEVPVTIIIDSVAGDNTLNIQSAINNLATYPLQSNGYRGAILFRAGTYKINSTIKISTSGIVLKGEGDATHFIATGSSQYDLIQIKGSSGKTDISNSEVLITDEFVPFGTKKIHVSSVNNFQIGDWVNFRREPNASWIHLLGMDTLSSIDSTATDWTPSSYKINFERRIVAIDNNEITLDAPIMDLIDSSYAKAYLVKFSSSRIEKCAVENLKMSSTYSSSTDENHGWNAIFLDNIRNAWIKNVHAYYFGYSCVNIGENSAFVTVDSCSMFDGVSILTGGRRYSFNIDGQRSLVKNCVTRNGRHDYVTGSRTAGPSVFYNCTATLQNADMGPHHRWATGILFDNINGDGQLRIQNRLSSGSGHGWAGAQIMFWNCIANDIVIQDPPTYHQNWAIGCIGPITNMGQWSAEPIGYVESNGTSISNIPSLFIAQLNDRTKKDQSITFDIINEKIIGDQDFNLTASSTSGLPLSYTSSNPLVANIVGNRVHINAIGNTTIIASQQGNNYYRPASNVSRALTVNDRNNNTQTVFFKHPVSSTFDFYYHLMSAAHVQLNLFDVKGQLIKSVFDKIENEGNHTEYDINVNLLPNGTYFLQFTTNNNCSIHKLTIIH